MKKNIAFGVIAVVLALGTSVTCCSAAEDCNKGDVTKGHSISEPASPVTQTRTIPLKNTEPWYLMMITGLYQPGSQYPPPSEWTPAGPSTAEWTKKGLTSVKSDEKNTAIIATGTEAALEEFAKAVAACDVKPKMVMISVDVFKVDEKTFPKMSLDPSSVKGGSVAIASGEVATNLRKTLADSNTRITNPIVTVLNNAPAAAKITNALSGETQGFSALPRVNQDGTVTLSIELKWYSDATLSARRRINPKTDTLVAESPSDEEGKRTISLVSVTVIEPEKSPTPTQSDGKPTAP